MTQNSYKIFTLLLLLLFSSLIFAQGNISGTITDSLSNDALIGANVVILGTSQGAATDYEGQYRIKNVPEGEHVVRISYLGYKSKDIKVRVVSSRTLALDVNLLADIVESETVLVSA
ncbi:MAG: carboxypeptidase-like regulatory domain-containing protein, partial [Melioribacteraceae bacterium]|nr:carboxypeptidase-like regulatory domain-containing protein [Melioribacteraceae bacterium]